MAGPKFLGYVDSVSSSEPTFLGHVDLGLAPQRNAIAAGLSSGVDSLQGLGYSALGGVADAFGVDAARDWANEQARRNAIDAALNGRPDLERIEDQSLGSALPYAGYQIAKQVPLMGAIMGAQAIPGVGQAASTLGLARLGASAPRIIGGGGLEAGANFAARRAALAQGESLGSQALMGSALGYGSLYGESVEGGDPSPYASAALAPFYGLAEAAVPAAVRGALRAPSQFAGGLGTRILKAGALGAVGEAGTEGIQNEMEMALNGNISADEAFSRRLNSMAAGGLVGGSLGSFGGIGGRAPTRTVDEGQFDLTQREQGPTLGLGYSPLAGTPIVFPDGSVALNGEQELTARYGAQPVGTGGYEGPTRSLGYSPLAGTPIVFPDGSVALSGDQAFSQQYAPQGVAQTQQPFNLVTQMSPLQQRIDQNLGIGQVGAPRGYTGQFTAAYDEPTNVVGNDAATGKERPLTLGQLYQLQAGGQPAAVGQNFDQETEAVAEALGLKLTDSKGKPLSKRAELFTKAVELRKVGAIDDGVLQATAEVLGKSRYGEVQQVLNQADQDFTAKRAANVSQPSAPAGQPVGSSAGRSVAPVGGVGNTGSVPDGQLRSGGDAGNTQPAGGQAAPVADAGVQRPAAVDDPLAQAWEDHKDDDAGDFASLPANQQQIWRDAVAAKTSGKQVNLYKVAEQLGAEGDVDPRQQILRNVFGVRNGDIIFDKVGMGMSEEAVAEKYGMSRANVQKIAGATGQKGWAGLLAKAKSKFGYTEEQIMDAFRSNTPEAPEAASEVEEDVFNEELDMDPLLATEAGLDSITNSAGGGKANVGAKEVADLQKRIAPLLEQRMELLEKGELSDEDRAKLEEIEAKLAPELEKAKKALAKAKTQKDSGQKLWEKLRKVNKDLVTYEELSDLDRDYLTELADRTDGKPKIKEEMGLQELMKRTPDQQSWNKKSAGANTLTDLDGNDFAVVETTLDKLQAYPGVRNMLRGYRRNGLEHVLGFVQGWYVTSANVDWDGTFSVINGKPSVVFNMRALVDANNAEWTGHHELAHAFDQVHIEKVGNFSSDGVLNLRIVDGKIVPQGAVIREVLEHYNAEPDSPLSTRLVYPLDTTANADLDATKMRQEVFAQLWAAYNTENGREWLEDNLPTTAEYLESVNDELKAARPATATQATKAGEWSSKSGQVRQERSSVPASGEPQAEDQVRFGKETPGTGQVYKRVMDQVPNQFRGPVKDVLTAVKDFSAKGLDYVIFTNDLIDRAIAAGVKSAEKFRDLLVARATEVRKNEREVERIADMYALVPEKDRQGPRSVNNFLFESTRQGKWGYDNGKFKADPEMANWFNSLDPKTHEFVRAVFKHGDDVLAKKKQTVLKYTETEYDARIAAETDPKIKAELEQDKTNSLKRFQRLFALREGMPYAPIKRSGSHVVVASSAQYKAAKDAKDTKLMAELEKSEDHYQVTFTNSKWEARRLSERLAAEPAYANGDVYFRERDQHQDKLYGGDGVLSSLEKLRKRVENSDDKSSAKMLRVISDLYLEALAENSARKSEMRRRGIAGDVDMVASFAQQGKADANFMASVQYGQQIKGSIQSMTNEVQDARDEGRASELRNELLKRYEQTLDAPQTPWLNRLTRLSSIYYLATSPAYYMQNLTQPWMMSVPAMAGLHNWTKVNQALFKAYGELKGVVSSGKAFKQNFDLTKVPGDVRDVIKELANRGKIDIGLESEMGEFSAEGQGKVAGTINKIDKGLRLAVQKVETINRLSTAIAAYRLELARTGDVKRATDYADRILTETHGDYTGMNAPRAFNTPLGKVALQFRKFQLVQLSYYAKLVDTIFADPKERKAAMKMLGYSLGHTALFAGVRGLPGFAALAFVASKLLGDDDEPYDLEAEMRKAIGDTDLANLIMRGTPTLAGLDISGKVGAGNMLSILPFSNADLTTQQGRAQAAGELVLGASGGMVSRMADGLGQVLGGDVYRGLESLLPKGLGDVLKAGREASEGMTRRNGDLMLSPEEISYWETLWQGLGVQSVQKGVVYEQQQRVRNMDDNFQERATRIKNDYAKAARQKDTEAMAEARNAWTKMQEARVRNGYTRQPLSNLLKAPQEQAKREKNTREGVAFDKNNQRFVESQI